MYVHETAAGQSTKRPAEEIKTVGVPGFDSKSDSELGHGQYRSGSGLVSDQYLMF